MQIPSVVEQLLVVLATATATWIFSRQKQKADAKLVELETVEKAIAIWRGIAEDISTKFEELTHKCEELTIKCDALSEEIEDLRAENKILKASLAKAIKTYQG